MLNTPQLEFLKDEFIKDSWVNPFGGFNRGYRLEPSLSRPIRRSISIYGTYCKMPSSDDLSCYQMPVKSLTWIKNTSILDSWSTLIDYCNETGTLFTIISPRTGEMIDLSKCYVGLVRGKHPILITPYHDGPVDVNIMLSTAPHKYSITEFSLTGIPGEDTSSIDNLVAGGMVYIDGKYHSASSTSDLPSKSSGYIINNPGIQYVASSTVSKLETYQHADGTFYIVSLGIDGLNIYHYMATHFHIVSPASKVGITLDKTSWIKNIHQLSGDTFGIRASYIGNLCTLSGMSLEDISLDIQVMGTGRKSTNNAGYSKTIDGIESIDKERLMSNGDNSLQFLYGSTLSANRSNNLHLINLPNVKLDSDMFEGHVVDNILMTKSSKFDDDRVIKYMLSGREVNKYSALIKYSTTPVNIGNYVLPVIYTANGEYGVFGTDYYVGESGALTLLNGSYVVDHNGRYEIVVNRPFEIIDLSILPLVDHPNISYEISANDIYLHEGIDYRIKDGKLIVWKAGVTAITIAMYFSTYKRKFTSWVRHDEIQLPKHEVYAMSDRISVYSGDGQLDPSHIIPAKNGTPFTIEHELLDLVNSKDDIPKLISERNEFDTNISNLEYYYSAIGYPDEAFGFEDFYFLVSPLMIDVLNHFREFGNVPTPNEILVDGIAKCIPDNILFKYYDGYDPSTTSNMDGEQFVIIKGHDEADIKDVTAEEWNLLRHVNSSMLRGRVTLELYYRIVYEQ